MKKIVEATIDLRSGPALCGTMDQAGMRRDGQQDFEIPNAMPIRYPQSVNAVEPQDQHLSDKRGYEPAQR